MHSDVLKVLQAVCILMRIDPGQKSNQNGKKIEDWETPARKMLSNT